MFAFVNLASAAGRRHLTGIYRFLGEGRAWDLNLVRSFADYSPRVLRAFAFAAASTTRAWSEERGAAFAAELAGRGHAAVTIPNAEALPQKELAQRLLALPKPCGVFAAYDDVGRRIVETARDAGLKVPDDMEVLSVGDDEMVCDYVRPTLTSLAPDFETEGYRAARELQAMMFGARPKRRVFLVGLCGIEERGSTRNASVGQSIVRAARAYIAANALRGISAADVVRHLGVSRSLADLRFREETGTSLLQAILDVRLGKVKRLLAETDLPVGEIARRAGYANANYLKNLFRRHVGQSMRDWRRALAKPVG